ncbi:MAG TPA: sugar ABC transporter permease [Acetivibrio sp.]|uniref:carbohydrate ABC transporter permease n=1 Tax=Acetivibrio sp. TaxID=1872092 RepID=UPI002CBCC17B|nr:sugar ABC transporter permease [Acetivibrio sp.]HOM01247.1 sugar ABC transporter permease [Acetivibrio sp.]
MDIQLKKSGIGVKEKRSSHLLYSIKQNLFAYAMLIPAFVCMLCIHFIPMLQGIYMSFLDLNMMTMTKFLKAPFIGLGNYYEVLFDKESLLRTGFWFALRNTAIYTFLVTFSTFAFGIILAMLVNREFKGRGIVRTALLLPWVVPSYVVGMIWGFLWRQDSGLINIILHDILHILPNKPYWLVGRNQLWAIIIPTIWRGLPLSMILMLAGLQSISPDYYEAADIDGANGWQKFWNITLPLLKPILAINVMFSLISNIYSYNIVAMMFGNGAGIPGDWGDLLMTNIQRNSFQLWQFGPGAAAMMIVMFFVLGIVALWYSFFKDDLVVK